MKWSFKIGVILGIEIKVHAIFLMLLGFVGWSNASAGGPAAGLAAVIFFLTIFFFVLLHELGHSIAARRYGVVVRDIVLLPIGGVARMESLPQNPRQELVIAFAGPAVNFVAVIVLYFFMRAMNWPVDHLSFDLSGKDFWNGMLSLNAFMGLFNLIPAFPMDGGRVLRALLAMRYPYAQATRYASSVGQIFAVLFSLAGIFFLNNWWLVIIAVFIFTGAGSEESVVRLRAAIEGVPVGRVMSTRLYTLSPVDPLRKALEHSYQGCQDDFPVLEDNRLIGILPKSKVMSAIYQRGVEAPVRDFMETRFTAVRPLASLARVYEEMLEKKMESVPVVEGSQILGMLTLENIGRYFMVASSLEKNQRVK